MHSHTRNRTCWHFPRLYRHIARVGTRVTTPHSTCIRRLRSGRRTRTWAQSRQRRVRVVPNSRVIRVDSKFGPWRTPGFWNGPSTKSSLKLIQIRRIWNACPPLFLQRLAKFIQYHDQWNGIIATDSKSLIDTIRGKCRSQSHSGQAKEYQRPLNPMSP